MDAPRALRHALSILLCLGAAAWPAGTSRAEDPGAAGARLYRDCAACHGADGGGVADGSVPAIGGQPATVIAAALRDFRAARRQDLRMQHFSDPQHLADEAEVEAVSAHVAALRRTTPAGTGDGLRLALGEALFAQRCAGCHGATAEARERPPRAALAGQHAGYIARRLRGGPWVAGQAGPHRSLSKAIGDDGIAAVADWLSRLPQR